MPYPVGHDHRLALSVSALAAVLALAPAGAQSRWARDPAVRFRAGDSWGPYPWAKGQPRLACDRDRNLYLNLDDSLLVGAVGGASWRAEPRRSDTWLRSNTPLALGQDGTLLWDNRVSRDHGRTWKPIGTGIEGAGEEGPLNATALGALADGSLLAGTDYDRLVRSSDTGRTWSRVHFGNTYGTITGIVPGDRKWAFAAPAQDDLLASRDGGKTWAKAVGLAQGKAPERIVARFLACIPEDDMLFAMTDPPTGDPTLEDIRWVGDSLLITTY
jgi:hypothetical protein